MPALLAALSALPCGLAEAYSLGTDTPREVPTETIRPSLEAPAAPVPPTAPVPPDAGAPPSEGAEDMMEADPPEEDAPETQAGGAEDEPLPEVLYDPERLPTPVRRLREQIIEAAKTGDLEALRPVLEQSEMPPTISFGDAQDPVEYWRSISEEGTEQEVLAILVEIMQAGFLHVDQGTPQEMYVWPYFYRYPIARLTPAQKVELFEIVTAYDYGLMIQNLGTYTFYRVGIGPDGTWHFFVSGD